MKRRLKAAEENLTVMARLYTWGIFCWTDGTNVQKIDTDNLTSAAIRYARVVNEK